MRPTGRRAGSLPFLHRTTVTPAQSVLCKAAIVRGRCSLGVLVQYMSSCLGPWPPFLSWLWKPLFSSYKTEQNTQQNGGGGRPQREPVYPRSMDQQPKQPDQLNFSQCRNHRTKLSSKHLVGNSLQIPLYLQFSAFCCLNYFLSYHPYLKYLSIFEDHEYRGFLFSWWLDLHHEGLFWFLSWALFHILWAHRSWTEQMLNETHPSYLLADINNCAHFNKRRYLGITKK